MKPRLVISDMYRAKNKLAFFAIHQALTKFHMFELEFHILWDDVDFEDEWTKRIEELDCKIISYTKPALDQYCLDYGIPEEVVAGFKRFNSIYFIVHAHYLKKNNITDYYLIYDDDIVIGDGIEELVQCLEHKVPCLITEPMNAGCDKTMANILLSLYPGSYEYYMQANPNMHGFNAGFQGVSLDMYDDFMEPEYFNFLLGLFNYSGIYDANGKEITGPERSAIDTQQQSFFGIMNIIRSKKVPHILNPNEYFVCPNWGVHPVYGTMDPSNEFEGWDINMKSKIVHFIGHTVFDGLYYGKPKVYTDLVNDYLKKHNII